MTTAGDEKSKLKKQKSRRKRKLDPFLPDHESSLALRKLFEEMQTHDMSAVIKEDIEVLQQQKNHFFGLNPRTRFVPRTLYILQRCTRSYLKAKQQQIEHLSCSITKVTPHEQYVFEQAQIQIQQLSEISSSLEETFKTFQQQFCDTISTLENYTNNLQKRDHELHPNFLRVLPEDIRKFIFTFLHVGFVYEPLWLHLRYRKYYCKYDAQSDLFILFADQSMKIRVLATTEDRLIALYESVVPRRYSWWSSHQQRRKDGDFRCKSFRDDNGRGNIRNPLRMLKSQTERVPAHGWKKRMFAQSAIDVEDNRNFFLKEILKIKNE